MTDGQETCDHFTVHRNSFVFDMAPPLITEHLLGCGQGSEHVKSVVPVEKWAELEVDALQTQVQVHFMLDSIKALCKHLN